jgi:hypothetical protein
MSLFFNEINFSILLNCKYIKLFLKSFVCGVNKTTSCCKDMICIKHAFLVNMKLSTKLSGKFYSHGACWHGIPAIKYVLPFLITTWTLYLTSSFARGMYVCIFL